jgi:hypothetical protein
VACPENGSKQRDPKQTMAEMKGDQPVLEWGNPLPEAQRYVRAGYPCIGMANGRTHDGLKESQDPRGQSCQPDRPSGPLLAPPPPRSHPSDVTVKRTVTRARKRNASPR